MSWKDQYRVVGVKPGRIITRQYGEMDFTHDDIPCEKCERLVKEGFPYLERIPKPKGNNKESPQ